jgi:hypothetical protein
MTMASLSHAKAGSSAPHPSTGLRRLLVNGWLGWLMLAGLALLIALTAMQYQKVDAAAHAGHGAQAGMLIGGGKVPNQRILNDFEDFYIVGQLYPEGTILKAYDNDYLLAAQQRLAGAQTFMPWAYPPPMTALMPILPHLGLALSYLLFTGDAGAVLLRAARLWRRLCRGRSAGDLSGAGARCAAWAERLPQRRADRPVPAGLPRRA